MRRWKVIGALAILFLLPACLPAFSEDAKTDSPAGDSQQPAAVMPSGADSNTADNAGSRIVLHAKLGDFDAKLKEGEARRLELREAMRAALTKRSELPDKSALDEETRELMDRVGKAEAELRLMRAELREKLQNNPAYNQFRAEVDALRDELNALTVSNRTIQSERLQTLSKLEEVERQRRQQ